MQIREMLPEDTAEMVSIIAAHEEWDRSYAQEYFDGYFQRVKDGTNSSELNFVAVVDDVAVGTCGYAPPKMASDDVLWGTWLYVHESQRGTGTGGALLKHTLEAMQKVGARKAYLETSSDESYATAVALYQSFGFEIEGTLKDYYEKGEDLLIMGAVLGDKE